jgi:hypothetical protein
MAYNLVVFQLLDHFAGGLAQPVVAEQAGVVHEEVLLEEEEATHQQEQDKEHGELTTQQVGLGGSVVLVSC